MFTAVLMLHILSAISGIGATIFMATLMPRLRGAPDAQPVMKYVGANLRVLGPLSLAVLWITGAWLAYGYGLAESGGVWFQVKVGLVLVLTVLVAHGHYMRYRMARGADPKPLMAMMRVIQPVNTAVAILVVVTAVLAFR